MSDKRKPGKNADSFPWRGMLGIAAIPAVGMAGMLLLSALLLLRQEWGDGALTPLAFVCCALPALLGGLLAGKRMKHSGWLYGALCVLPQIAALCVLCFVLYGTGGKLLAAAVSIILLCGVIGGVLGVNARSRRKYKAGRKR